MTNSKDFIQSRLSNELENHGVKGNRKSFEKDRYKTPFKRNLSKIKLSDISKLRPLTEGIQSGYQIARYLG